MCLYIFKDYMLSKYDEQNFDQTPEHLYFNRFLYKNLKKNLFQITILECQKSTPL